MTILRQVPVGPERRKLLQGTVQPVSSGRPTRGPEAAQSGLGHPPKVASESGVSLKRDDREADDQRAQALSDAASRIDEQVEAQVRAIRLQSDQAERLRVEEHALRLRSLEGLLEGLRQAVPLRWDEVERQALELAFTALCRVMGPDHGRGALLTGLVQQGMAALRGHALVSVRMHPTDLDVLTEHTGAVCAATEQKNVQWLADATLERAACIVVSDHGQIDAGLATQIERLRALWAGHGRREAGGSLETARADTR